MGMYAFNALHWTDYSAPPWGGPHLPLPVFPIVFCAGLRLCGLFHTQLSRSVGALLYSSCLGSHMGETLWVCRVVEPSSNGCIYKTLPHLRFG